MSEEEESGGGEGGWLVSYADLMTLLFAAFVVLYGITPQGESKVIMGAASSIRESFIEIPDDISEDEQSGEVYKGKLQFKAAPRRSQMPKNIKKFNNEQTLLDDFNQDKKRIEVHLKEKGGAGMYTDLPRLTEVFGEEKAQKLRLVGRSYFEGESIILTKQSQEELLKLAPELKKLNRKIIIEGHTDSKPATGKYSNLELSALRAEAVMNFLRSNGGIPKEFLRIASYGGRRPVESNRTSIGRQKNRRVEMKIAYKEELY